MPFRPRVGKIREGGYKFTIRAQRLKARNKAGPGEGLEQETGVTCSASVATWYFTLVFPAMCILFLLSP